MPWNSQGGGGGWQGGGQGPWGGRPGGGGGGGGPQPPDLEDLIRKSQERVKDLLPSGGGGGIGARAIALALVVLLVIWGATGFYRVLPEEQGVQLLFGRLSSVSGPGLHWWWPSPIGDVQTPQVTRVNRVEIGFRSAAASRTGRDSSGVREVTDEALMLTGDENIVDINFVVLWKIDNAADYLFNIREQEETVKAAAESTMREIIGQTPIAEATTEGRRAIEQQAREQLQSLMTQYGAGIVIDEVQLQKADPPAEVIDAFRDVQRAQADRERAQNEAESFANDIIPRARGEAERLIQEAEAYKQEVITRAEGEAQRFKSVLTEYRQAQDVTIKRLYLETMEDVLAGMNKVIIDGDSGSGVVPYLPLPELERRANESRAAATSQTGNTTGGNQ